MNINRISHRRQGCHILLGVALAFAAGLAARAADTEIYFSGAGNGISANANVLFILDTSSSMLGRTQVGGTRQSRLDALKEAATSILTDLENTGVGLMRFNHLRGGPVLFPIANLDDLATTVVGEEQEFTNTITEGANDGVQAVRDIDNNIDISDGPTNFIGPTLTARIPGENAPYVDQMPVQLPMLDYAWQRIGELPVNTDTGNVDPDGNDPIPDNDDNLYITGRDNETIGLLFNLPVPRNARIDSAQITFTAAKNFTGSNQLTIEVEDSDQPRPLIACGPAGCLDDDIENRPRTDARTFTISAVNQGDPINLDSDINGETLAEIIQDLVSRGVGRGDGMPGPPGNECYQNVPPGDGGTYDPRDCTYIGPILFILSGSTGGMVEVYGDDPAFRPMLSIEYEAPETFIRHRIGLRFEDVRIPRGADVTQAKLILTPSAATDLPSGATVIFSVDVDTTVADGLRDSPPFDASNDITSRPRTTMDEIWQVSLANDWEPGSPIGSDNLHALVDTIVSHSGWCGGNALTFFIDMTSDVSSSAPPQFDSFEHSGGSPASFVYSYNSNGATPCVASTEAAQVASSNGDAVEIGINQAVNTLDPTLGIGEDQNGEMQTVGLRFETVNVPQNGRITEAFLEFYSEGSFSNPDDEFTIKGLIDTNPPGFVPTSGDISTRTTTTAVVNWTLETDGTPPQPIIWEANRWYDSGNIATVVQEIVNTPGWTRGDSMGFVIEPVIEPLSGNREASSYDGNPFYAPRLRIRYQEDVATGAFVKTVRESQLEIVNNLPAFGSTPTQTTLYEAFRYWRGESMVFGDTRLGTALNQVSHPGSYCESAGNCRGAAEDNPATPGPETDEFGTIILPMCNDSGVVGSRRTDTNAACAQQEIVHDDVDNKARYISPLDSSQSCLVNHQILLSDGQLNVSDDTLVPVFRDLVGKSSCYSSNASFKPAADDDLSYTAFNTCLVDLVEFMATNDQSAAVDGDQVIKTSTIAFNLDPDGFFSPLQQERARNAAQYLKDFANLGQGGFYEAASAQQLIAVFESILIDVRSNDTSFVSPSLATNAFNRLLSRDEIYFGLFTPSPSQAWLGNVKKYNVCVDSTLGCSLGEILDADRNSAIDSADARFRENARSIWSTQVDGRATTEGGTGAQITDFTLQTLYTDRDMNGFAPANTPLSNPGFRLQDDSWDAAELETMRASVCPNPDLMNPIAKDECEDRMLWLLGKKIITDADNDVNNDQRWSVNDVLHSSPAIITYGGSGNTFFDKVIFGTNDGSLHFVNAASGEEEWRFLPSDFWSAQQSNYVNPEGEHTYGMDITPTIWRVDNNRNGIIEPSAPENDSIRVFLATRRGGSFLYALDLTAEVNAADDPVVPRFLWRIQGQTTDFPRLSQTWSQPQLTSISILDGTDNVRRDVLVFGGGWDPALDDATAYAPAAGTAFLGNAIYIVDPTNGSLIMSISGTTGSNIVVPEMVYSIPSRIRLIDSNADGLTDRLYVGDTGGQIFRVDLDPNIEPASTTAPEAGTVVGLLASISDATVGMESERRRFFEPPSVVQVRDEIYSDIQEYDYVLIGTGYRAHPLDLTVQDRFYAFRDYYLSPLGDDDGDNLAESTDNYPVSDGAFTNADLIDVTANPLVSTEAAVRGAAGWYYDFTSAGSEGEKVLSAATTTAGIVTFTTFRPDAALSNDPCASGVGNAFAYNFDILSADAALDWDGDGDINSSDRSLALGSGIPSGVVPIFTREGVVGIVGIEGGAAQLGVLAGLPRFRTYWYEES